MAMTKIQEEARVAQLVDSYGAHGLAMMLIEAEHRGELIRFDFTNADGQPDCKMITHDEMRQRYADMSRSNAMQKQTLPDIKRIVPEAMQEAWDDWVCDTNNLPPDVKVHGPRTTRVSFQASTWAVNVAQIVERRLLANQLQPEHKSRVAQLVDTYGAHGLAMMLKGDTQVKRP